MCLKKEKNQRSTISFYSPLRLKGPAHTVKGHIWYGEYVPWMSRWKGVAMSWLRVETWQTYSPPSLSSTPSRLRLLRPCNQLQACYTRRMVKTSKSRPGECNDAFCTTGVGSEKSTHQLSSCVSRITQAGAWPLSKRSLISAWRTDTEFLLWWSQ
jgi:hypothetical protein